MIKGINHITISVSDLETSFDFYSRILKFKPLLKHSKGAYLLAGDLWFCLDLDPNTRRSERSEYTHIAFSVAQNDFKLFTEFVLSGGTKTWKDNVSEGDSLYILDPDGYKLEIHVGDWQSRIESYKGSVKASDMTFFV